MTSSCMSIILIASSLMLTVNSVAFVYSGTDGGIKSGSSTFILFVKRLVRTGAASHLVVATVPSDFIRGGIS